MNKIKEILSALKSLYLKHKKEIIGPTISLMYQELKERIQKVFNK